MKTQDTWRTILKGVSQQAPAERLEGAHGEQVNLISDPVHGLVRRNGMVLVNHKSKTYTTPEPDDAIADSYAFRAFPFSFSTNNYDLIYRSRPRVGAQTDAHLEPLMVFSKQGVRQFLPVVRDNADTVLDSYLNGGISSIVLLGRILLLAGVTHVPTVTEVDRYGANTNQDKAVVYVKAGANNRTYRVKAKNRSTGVTADISYTTPPIQYDGELKVDDLNFSDPDYQKYLNDRIYGYENATNEHTLMAAKAAVPSAIAEELFDLLVAAGMTGWVLAGNYIYNDDIEYVVVSEDSNDEMIQATHNEVESETKLSPRHYNGKIVKVTPIKGSDKVYYLEAQTEGGATFGEVVWRETAGTLQTITNMLAFATLENEKFYIASNPQKLHDLVQAGEGINIGVPEYATSHAGDLLSQPLPAFANRPISMLAVFQDRLVVAAGNVLRVSASGDYLNFYQQSMLTVAATDPAEIFANGTSGDVIRKASQYDRNLMMYGDNYHYVMPGRAPFDPANPQFSVQYEVQGAGRSQPVLAGDKVFVLKEDTSLAACQVLQMSPGVWQDSPAVETVTEQLRSYINGTPAEMVSLNNPSILFVRTEFINRSRGAYPLARPFGLYTFGYLDKAGNRGMEAWSAWEWSSALGTPIAIGSNGAGDGILLYTVAYNSGTMSVFAQDASARSEPTGMPYLDGLMPADATVGVLVPTSDSRVQNAVRTVRDASYSAVAPDANDFNRWDLLNTASYTIGDAPPQTVDPLRWDGVRGWGADWLTAHPGETLDGVWTGMHYAAFVDLTSPVMRNHEDKARLYGHLTLTKIKVSTVRTGGITAYVAHHSGTDQPLLYDAGYIRDMDHSVFVGRESSRVQVRLQSVEWHPLNISSLAWQGDWKNNQGRGR